MQEEDNPENFDNGMTQVFEEPNCKCGHKQMYHLKNIMNGTKLGACRVQGCKCKKYSSLLGTMEKITITIDKEIYKKLAQMKLDQDLRTFDEVLEFMLKKMKSKEKKS